MIILVDIKADVLFDMNTFWNIMHFKLKNVAY